MDWSEIIFPTTFWLYSKIVNSKNQKSLRSNKFFCTLQFLKMEENSYRTQDVTNKTYFLKGKSSGLHFRVTLLLLEWMKGLEIKSLFASFIVPRKPLRLFETTCRWNTPVKRSRKENNKSLFFQRQCFTFIVL